MLNHGPESGHTEVSAAPTGTSGLGGGAVRYLGLVAGGRLRYHANLVRPGHRRWTGEVDWGVEHAGRDVGDMAAWFGRVGVSRGE